MPKINYSKNTYCRDCDIKHPLGTYRCSVCNGRVATRPKSKKRILTN